MTDILMGIRSIECLSWEQIFINKIDKIREGEFYNYKRTRFIDIAA